MIRSCVSRPRASRSRASVWPASPGCTTRPQANGVTARGLFLTASVWKQQPENVCESATRGTRVVVTTRLKQRSYETKAGEKRTVYEVEADDVVA